MLRRVFLLTLLIGALAGCGGGNGIIKRINPPVATLQKLAIGADGTIAVEVRIQNHSTVPMKFLAVDAAVRIAGIDAGRLALAPNIDIPGMSADVVGATLTPPANTLAALRTQFASGRPIGYVLDGSITTEDPGKTFPFTFDSRLSPVPGRPGEFR